MILGATLGHSDCSSVGSTLGEVEECLLCANVGLVLGWLSEALEGCAVSQWLGAILGRELRMLIGAVERPLGMLDELFAVDRVLGIREGILLRLLGSSDGLVDSATDATAVGAAIGEPDGLEI